MDTLSDLRVAVQDDINVGDESTLYPPALIDRYINRAYRNKVAALFPWPELQDAKKTPTQANVDYYDYPQNLRSNSICKLIVTGINVILIWEIKVPASLDEDTDTTVFSYSTPECNEAIVLETVAMLKSKGDSEKSAEFRSAEAKQILVVSWNKIKTEMAKYEKIAPFFYVNDFFGRGTSKDLTGKFDVNM